MKIIKIEFLPDADLGLYIYAEHKGIRRVFTMNDLIRIWNMKDDEK